MDTARWRRIQDLFHAAVDQPPRAQRAILEAGSPDDPTLVDEVLAMLREDSAGSSPMDGEVSIYAPRILDSAVPRSCGPYRVIRKLGEGGMGVVYLGEREDLGNPVAIKFLRDAWMSPARRERFASEQRTLAQLNHPSIARLYDADALPDGTPWFVMEYVEGICLTDYCRRHESSLAERLAVFRSVCEAVHYAHLRAVIHRDLKPSNILVKADGTVRLLDFGIAKQLETLDTPADQTRTALRLMTPAYAAPEQVRGEQVGIFTDVYALGVILYELLSGHLPFDLSNRTPAEVERTILGKDAEKPSVAARQGGGVLHVSNASWADLDVLCLTAMHKDLRRRYRSVEALIRDIDHFRGDQPLDAHPDTMRYRMGKFMSRNRRAVSVAALMFLIVAGGSGFFALRLTTARRAEASSAARAQRVQNFMLNLFNAGDRSSAPTKDLRVEALLDRGVQEAHSLGTEPAVQADLYLTLGTIFQKLGKLDRADSLLHSALEGSKSLGDPDRSAYARSFIAIGLLRVDQAKLGEAERFVREGLAETARSTPPNSKTLAQAKAALGKVLEAQGKYADAVLTLNEAVALESASGVATPEFAASLKELADTHFYMGHYDLCDSLNYRALAMHRRLFGASHPLVADDLINIGAVQSQRGHYVEAEKSYRRALEINRAWYGDEHPETASSLMTVAQALIFEKRFDEGEKDLTQALAIQERFYGPSHPRVAIILNELAGVASQRDRYDRAAAYYDRAIDIWRKAYGDRSFQVAVAMSNLATVYLKQKNYGRAEGMFRDVIRRFTESLSAGHFNTGIAQIKLGRTLVQENRFAEAEAHTLAGYGILGSQTSPSVSWLQSARTDLVTIYKNLDQPGKAARYQRELTQVAGKH
jgi:serine/threonine protein kinase/Tfp pilus assembly protein PilF